MAAGDVSVAVTDNNSMKAAVFDGVNDNITVTDPTDGSLDFGSSQDFSISFWIKINAFSAVDAYSGIIDKGVGAVGYSFGIGGSSDNGKIRFRIENGGQANSLTGVLDLATWYHITATVERTGNQLLYVNSTLVDTDVASGIGDIDNATDLRIGADNLNRFLNGQIADVKVWKKVLSLTEVTQNYQGKLITNRLISRWNFADGTYNDSIGSNDGTNSGSYISIVEDAIALQIKSQRVTANDKFLTVGIVGGQLVTPVIEEAP